MMVVTSPTFGANEKDVERLKNLIANHDKAYSEANDWDAIIDTAKKVHSFTPKVYGKNSIEYAEAKYKLAYIYDLKGGVTKTRDEVKAHDYYEDYFRLAKKIKIPINEEYVSKYVRLLKTKFSINGIRTKYKYIEQAVNYAEEANLSPEKIADIELDILNAGRFTIRKDGKIKLLSSAIDKYKEYYGDQHYKYAELLLLNTKFKTPDFSKDSAKKQIKIAINILTKEDITLLDLNDQTHRLLIEFYEIDGQSEKADYHCRKLAVERSSTDTNLPPILYAAMPNIMNNEEIEDGLHKIQLSLLIDKDGKVKETNILESTNNLVTEKYIEAISKWRFAPSIQNSEFIEVSNAKFTTMFHKKK